MEQFNFVYGNDEYTYHLCYQDRKTVRLTVYPNLNIILYCPKDYTKEKIQKFLKRTGHLCTGLIAKLNGYEFRVHSNDHDKHFHIIHKEKGIDARFSFPGIKLIDYKKCKNRIHSKQIKSIQKLFRDSKHFEKLEKEFIKRDKE